MANEFIARNGLIAQNNSTVTGSLVVTDGITGSLYGTASWATNASTSSYVLNAVSSSFSTTSSYALTASYALNGGGGSVTGGTLSGSFGITIDGGGSAITTGNKGYLTIPYGGTITGWRIISDQSGSCVVDVWKTANAIPTSSNTITGTEKPTLSSQQLNTDTTLTTWTSSVSPGDIFAFNVDSASTVTRVNVSIYVTKQ